MTKTMQTSASESLNAAGNIFVGQVGMLGYCITQQNSYSISHLPCIGHGDYTVDQLCSHSAAGSYQRQLHRHCPVTVQSQYSIGDW